MAHCLRCVGRNAVKPSDLIPGALVQALLIRLLARLRAEPHAPVALGAAVEVSSAMVAVQRHELRVHALGDGARYPITATELLKAAL